MWAKAVAIFTLIMGAAGMRFVPPQYCNPMPANAHVGPDPGVLMIPSHIPNGCSEFEVLIARGMGEQNSQPNGKFGRTVGDSLMGNLTVLIPGARGYPVQYPASVHMLEDNQKGKSDIITRLVKRTSACPNQKFALVGFSQGAVVVRLAAAEMSEEIIPKILAVVVYGDPTIVGDPMAAGPVPVGKMSVALSKRLQENCSKGDFTCDTSPGCHSNMDRHMDYERQPWIDRGAGFIAAAFKGAPMPAEIGRTHSVA